MAENMSGLNSTYQSRVECYSRIYGSHKNTLLSLSKGIALDMLSQQFTSNILASWIFSHQLAGIQKGSKIYENNWPHLHQSSR
jgi:hypothetical protein